MKSLEQLKKLAQNPFYNLSEEELEFLQANTNQTKEQILSLKKVNGSAIVKETGQLKKIKTEFVNR